MPSVVALAVRFPDRHALAGSWNVVEGTLSLPGEGPPAGARVVLDGRLGEVGFLLGGSVVAGPDGSRFLEVDEACGPVIEALLEPPARGRAVA